MTRQSLFQVFSGILFLALLTLISFSCGKGADEAGTQTQSAEPSTEEELLTSSVAPSHSSLLFHNFDQNTIPTNGAGETYPSQYRPDGAATLELDATPIAGNVNSLRYTVTGGKFYAQFNAKYANGLLGFAREFGLYPDRWQFNTYNRLSFWIKVPREGSPLLSTGQENTHVGTYCKEAWTRNPYTDETRNRHYYHHFNLAPTNTWTYVVMNQHPDAQRNVSGQIELGNLSNPTGEPGVNYFDCLTRFYLTQNRQAPSSYPASFQLDQLIVYQEPHPENDSQIYSIAATYVRSENRLILTWSRHKDENKVNHEVRYAARNIHYLGWEKANQAPYGVVKPLGYQGYNGMRYETTAIPLQNKKIIYLAIKPQNASTFSQIALPLGRL